jgi:hypothetical protein
MSIIPPSTAPKGVSSIGEIAKLLAHLIGPALTILATASAFSPTIAAQVIVAILAGIPLYWVAAAKYKAAISFAVVVVQGVLAWFGPSWGWGHPSWQSWVALLVSALVAGGVLVIPNATAKVFVGPGFTPFPAPSGAVAAVISDPAATKANAAAVAAVQKKTGVGQSL